MVIGGTANSDKMMCAYVADVGHTQTSTVQSLFVFYIIQICLYVFRIIAFYLST